MAFDKTKPDGDVSIGLGDDAVRDNNDALETAIGQEHVFSTGGSQTGRHSFVADTTSNINAMSPAPVDGSIALDESISATSGARVLVSYTGSAWEAVDVGFATVPHTDANDIWSGQQWSASEALTPAVGIVSIDMTTEPAKRVTASGDITIANPSGFVVNGVGMSMLTVTMSGAGHTISWGDQYVTAYGIPPAYDPTSGAVNVFHITKLYAGGFLVSSSPALATF